MSFLCLFFSLGGGVVLFCFPRSHWVVGNRGEGGGRGGGGGGGPRL